RPDSRRVLFGSGWILETIRGFSFEVGPDAFFQVHTVMAERMFERICREADRQESRRILELYAGSGVLATLLASPGRTVQGFESDAAAVSAARRNIRRNRVEGVQITERRVEEVRADAFPDSPDLVIADPPRAGLSDQALRLLFELRPTRLILVSCQPAILARDLQRWLAPGGYEIDWIQPFDLFPQTTHVETVVSLSRNR
ncbi:MAG: methyltransferase, partial [Kiritimatiellia bacterium]|nr:methyltransferase [Kiritimatiellia bacterium]